MATTAERQRQLQQMISTIQSTLTRLGYATETREGLWRVQFCDAVYVPKFDAGLIEVDVHRLPRRVKTLDLIRDDVLHELSTAIGGIKIGVINSKGLWYVIEFSEPVKVKLPRRVKLELDRRPEGELLVPLGVGKGGDVWMELPTLGHTLVCGTTGSGKSTFLHAALAALLNGNDPERLQVALVDPKRLEFAAWEGVPHLVQEIAHDVQQAEALLWWLCEEMDRRGDLLASKLARDIGAYNAKAKEPLPVILVVIDEVVDLALQAGKGSELVKLLARLASKARATGIVLWLAAQHPRFDVLPRVVSTNLSTRIVFRVRDAEAARLAGIPGAQSIPQSVPGRFMMRVNGETEAFQGYYLEDGDLVQVAQSLRGGKSRAVLTDKEKWVANIARWDLGGVFKIDDIYARTGPASEGGVSRRWLKDLAQRWEARGWLAKDPADPTRPRIITETLKELLNECSDD